MVLRGDLLHAGLGKGAVDFRVRERRLVPFMGEGAYLVGHDDPPPLAREYAALRLGGERSVISRWTAAVLYGSIREAPDVTVHVTLDDKRRSTGDITFHRGKLLRREVRTLHGDIRATSPARTIADIAHDLDEEDLERIVADAIRRKLTTAAELARYAQDRPGARKLRAVRQLDGGPQWTRSKAEAEFLKLVRTAALDAPRSNRRSGAKGRDFLWDEEKVLAEIDGFEFHGDRIAFEADRARDAERAARGWLTVRFTWRRIRDEPIAVAAELSAVLSLRRDR